MGGGNAQKSKTARDRNLAKKLKDQKQKNHAANKDSIAKNKEAYKCKICMTTFMCTTRRDALEAHYSSKHESKGFSLQQCFPELT